MRPVAEYQDVDRERFEAEIVPRGRPAVLRGLVADWPAVEAGRAGDEALAQFLTELRGSRVEVRAPARGGAFGAGFAGNRGGHKRRGGNR